MVLSLTLLLDKAHPSPEELIALDGDTKLCSLKAVDRSRFKRL
jgi:hypothetical protein